MKKCCIAILILCLIPVGVHASAKSKSPTSFFDSYGDLRWEWEKARLDNFAIFLLNNPTFVGHIFVWAGKRACRGEAQARALRAKKYLVDYRKVEWNRVIWHDNGYAEEVSTILEPMSRERAMLEFDSHVKPSEVQYLKDCNGGIPVRRRRTPFSAAHKRLQRTGISVSLIDNLPHDAVVARPLKRSVRCFAVSCNGTVLKKHFR